MKATAYLQFKELEDSHFWLRARQELFIRLLDAVLTRRKRKLTVLEVGCGTGSFLKLLPRYGDVYGIELSESWARYARDNGRRPVICGNAAMLPVRGETLDLICLFDVLEHIDDEQAVLRQAGAALKSGGIVFVSVPAYQILYSNNDRVSMHRRRYTRKHLTSALRRAGLEIVRSTYFNTLLFPLILPVVLFRRLTESTGLARDAARTNLSIRIPGPLDALLLGIMRAESRLLPALSLPFGHSIIAIARKPA